MKGFAMNLIDFVERYIDQRPICDDYAHTLRKRAAKLVAFAGRSDLAGVLNEATVNALLGTLTHLSPYTVNKYRGDYLAVWRSAADEDRIPYPQPRRIKRVRTLSQVIECYLHHEARALAHAAELLKGAYPNGVARRHYWPAIIRAAWDSGLRRGDLWRLDIAMIRRDLTAVVAQSKTNKIHVCKFRNSTVRAIKRAGGSLAWCCCRRNFGIHFQEVVDLSGIGRGTFRWLRRGSGSRLDADHPGRGHEQLGNSRQIFEKHYDAKLNGHKRPVVPEL